MATSQSLTCIGVDVSKAELVCSLDGAAVEVAANQRRAIRTWLARLPGPAALALEATGRYHQALAEEAYRRGHLV